MDRLRRKLQLLLLATGLFSSIRANADVADSLLSQRGEVHIRFAVPSNYTIQQLTQIMSIAILKRDTIDAFLNPSQWVKFKQLRIPYILVFPSKKFKSRNFTETGYPSEAQYVQRMLQFHSRYPDLCYIYDIGHSVRGRPLLFARINTDTLVFKPSVMLTSSMHGNETGGMILMLRLIDSLLSQRQANTLVKYLTDSLDIWINPLANPDGLYYDTADIYQSTRFNANGVDLNRNFPDPVMGAHPDGMAYQPETWAMMQLLKRYHFVMSANFHSGEEVVNYPWDSRPTLHPDDAWFKVLAKSYADSAIRYGANGYFQTYIGGSSIAGITNGYAWYPVFGGRQDYVTYYLRGREVTIEVDKNFITPENELDQLWQSNYRSLLAWLAFACQGIKGFVTDKYTGKPIAATISLSGNNDAAGNVVSDSVSGVFYRLLLPGTYAFKIFAAGYDTCVLDSIEVFSGKYTYLQVSLTPANGIKNTITHMEVYPNPVRDWLHLEIEQDAKRSYILLNAEGRVLKQGLWPLTGLNVSYLSPGIYYLRLKADTAVYRFKFLKLP